MNYYYCGRNHISLTIGMFLLFMQKLIHLSNGATTWVAWAIISTVETKHVCFPYDLVTFIFLTPWGACNVTTVLLLLKHQLIIID